MSIPIFLCCCSIQRFLSGLPHSYRDRIEFIEPKTLNDVIERLCIATSMTKVDLKSIIREKESPKESMISRIRKDSNTRIRIILPRMSSMDNKLRVDTSIVCQLKASSKNLSSVGDVERTIGSLQDCPHRKDNPRRLHSIEEATTVGIMAKATPIIYATLDNCQSDH